MDSPEGPLCAGDTVPDFYLGVVYSLLSYYPR